MMLLLLSLPFIASAQSAASILDKAAAGVSKSGKISCEFTVKSRSGAVKGSFSSEGEKFRLHSPQATTWYDGKNMWTANNSTKEITLVNPSSDEVRQTNPFSYLRNYKKEYNVFYSKRKDNRRYLLLLNPRSANSEIKAVEIALNKKTLMPERFIIRDKQENVTTVTITSLSLKSNPGPEGYTCPVKAMSDYELVDLR